MSSVFHEGYLTGYLLVSSPFVNDLTMASTVIFVCGHDTNGAIGLIINRPMNYLSVHDFMQQLGISDKHLQQKNMLSGGTVDVSRGFVIHSNDFSIDSTVFVDSNYGVTSTLEILREIGKGGGPSKHLILLGYTGWKTNQLDLEVSNNQWFICEPNAFIMFEAPYETRWASALSHLGISNTSSLSHYGGEV
jgi:putative transcriptional regulator